MQSSGGRETLSLNPKRSAWLRNPQTQVAAGRGQKILLCIILTTQLFVRTKELYERAEGKDHGDEEPEWTSDAGLLVGTVLWQSLR